ncbi:MAG: phospho-N-acetylmuramoyl-pentapeptide-transferase [Candidatus Cloacimonetes bacterium]|jgi:phospho-N-acetylmuramoyl-pentapeptide-transferase|nr:phospho-N-acetylmuramoyl-pentapeptide-transferase [Candidatus Cloacimonadota bacterium]MBT6994190.1 phospho-N-acetylmuramoyl-pentapeptide-transferase [Candidatus Cloacimonadota bacterium]
MFYHLFKPLLENEIFGLSIFNVFQYITFRAIAAFITASFFSLILGPKFIKLLEKHKAIESVNPHTPASHKIKAGTPTMGGLIVICGLLLSVLLWNNLLNSYIIILIVTTIWLGGTGFLDDFKKNFLHQKQGLKPKYKLFSQITLGVLVASVLYFSTKDESTIIGINIPFIKNYSLHLGWFFIPFVIFMITATSNAVNLTDGLDGLASGIVILSSLGLGIMAYLKGNFNIANYLNLEFISNAGELTIFIAALIGTLLGFLWYNIKPAQIFLGDTGSMALGGILSVLAILLREEIFFFIIGGLFVFTTLSSLIQRYYFKYTRKKYGDGVRFYSRAPIHHHYEEKGISEEKIVVRYWIVTALLVAIGLATIKLR